MKINVTTDQGTLVKHITQDEIGDISSPLARADLWNQIVCAITDAVKLDAREFETIESVQQRTDLDRHAAKLILIRRRAKLRGIGCASCTGTGWINGNACVCNPTCIDTDH